MQEQFKVGDHVGFITNRGSEGQGVIVEIRTTGQRGTWFFVHDGDRMVAVRAKGLFHRKQST